LEAYPPPWQSSLDRFGTRTTIGCVLAAARVILILLTNTMTGSPAPSIPDKVGDSNPSVRSSFQTIRHLFTFQVWTLRAAYLLLVTPWEAR
jgi:hypothetical protein